MSKYKNFASDVIEYMGGKENISKAYHCFTRLRFTVYDESKINMEQLKKMPGQLGIKKQAGQYQMIIGKEVADVYKEVSKQLDIVSESVKPEFETKNNVKFKFNMNSIIDVIASLFTPILGVISGAGIVQGILAIFTSTNLVTGQNAQVLNLIGGSAMAVLPLLLAITAAKKFNVNIYLALVVAGVLISPTIIQNISPDKGTTNYLYLLGMQIPALSYAGAVFPSILMVLFLYFVEKGLDKVLPKIIKFVLLPCIALFIMIPLMLIVFGPIGNYIGLGLAKFIEILFSWEPWLAGMIYGALRPFTVIFGMHYAFFPVILSNLASPEARDFLLPIHLLTNYALAGAALGATFLIKKREEKQIATAATISGFFGVTEPALYGVMLKHKLSFVAAILTSATMGGLAAGLKLYSYAFASPSWLTIAGFFSPDQPIWKFIVIICLTFVSLGMSMSLTILFGIDEYKQENKNLYNGIRKYQILKYIKAYRIALKNNKGKNKILKEAYKDGLRIKTFAKGKILTLDEINNPTVKAFSDKKGFAVNINQENINAPFKGKIELVDTENSSIILKDTNKNVKVIIGMSAENLKVDILVKKGQEVELNETLFKIDLKEYKKNKLDKRFYLIILDKPDNHKILKEFDEAYARKNIKMVSIVKEV
ncbi:MULTISPECIES: PTS transporter subunit EIIC [Mesoplasma]|uniref:PTS beta-glucoside transporter subunit EIIBCA n=1 Tax=Mesoplasma florum TaxID=2151 RepID=A0A2R3P7P1_MESFO|nr:MULTISPECIES: PTS transporter subunit EIIC [Mesoplasma]AVN64508.1 PTS beta-glucoside transporter subunit EIIBCA [Mesoplasma florum]